MTFNNKCSGQGPFVVLVKVQSNKIYGGYNPIGYQSRKWKWLTSSNSFIFSFENDQDIHDMKIGRVINESRAILEDEGCNWYFFSFGNHLYINDQNLRILNVGNYNHVFDFKKKTDLPIEEIEVFSVVKR